MALTIASNGAKFFRPDQMDVEILLESDPMYASYKQMVSGIQQQMTLMAGASRSRGGMLANPYQAELAVAQQQMQQRRAELTPMLEHRLKKENGIDSNASTMTMQVIQGQAQLKQKQLETINQEYDAQLEKVENLSGFSADLIARRAELQSLHESNHEVAKEISRLELELRNEARIEKVQPATIPNEGSYVLKMIEVVGGALVTLVLTLFGVALWDYKAKRLNSGKDLESTCRLPVIGTVPSLRSGVGGLLGGRTTSETVIADSIDSIRAAIMFGAPGKEVKSVLVTSAVGHEGKSTIASQLAVSLARSGRRTLLIDADVRNPQQHAVFGLPLDRGFCDVIRGQANLEEVVQATPAEGLWILPAGRCDLATMQAMSSPVVPAIMDRVAEQFEFVILDSGPVLTGPEAMIYGQHVDAAILATRRDVSRVPKVDEASRRLQSVGIHVIGAVVNGARSDVRSNQLALTSSVS
jgi:capsular exopolysaccharide synthesis family protein